VCPVGRSCSQAERDQFGEYDKVSFCLPRAYVLLHSVFLSVVLLGHFILFNAPPQSEAC